MLNIQLTETEITHIMDALDARIEDLTDCLATVGDPMIEAEIVELTELNMDLFEALGRKDDDWDRNDAVPDAADAMIDAGVEARERMKLERLMQGTQTTVDVWSLDGLTDKK